MLPEIIKLSVATLSSPVLSCDQTHLFRAEICAGAFEISHLAFLFPAQIHFAQNVRGQDGVNFHLADEICERWIVGRESWRDVYSPMPLSDAAPNDGQRFKVKESAHNYWIELPARIHQELIERRVVLVCFTKRTRAGHGVISIRDAYDARGERNLLRA